MDQSVHRLKMSHPYTFSVTHAPLNLKSYANCLPKASMEQISCPLNNKLTLLHLCSYSLHGTQRILISDMLRISYRLQLLWPLVLIPRPGLEVQQIIFQLEKKKKKVKPFKET